MGLFLFSLFLTFSLSLFPTLLLLFPFLFLLFSFPFLSFSLSFSLHPFPGVPQTNEIPLDGAIANSILGQVRSGFSPLTLAFSSIFPFLPFPFVFPWCSQTKMTLPLFLLLLSFFLSLSISLSSLNQLAPAHDSYHSSDDCSPVDPM